MLVVPPEEFGIERGARSNRDCNYCFHEVVTKTEGQLIAVGFDAGQMRSLSPHTSTTEIATLARDTVEEHSPRPLAASIRRRTLCRYEPDKLKGLLCSDPFFETSGFR